MNLIDVHQKRILHLTADYSNLLHLPFDTCIGFQTYLNTGALVKFLTELNTLDRDLILPVRIVHITFLGGGNREVGEVCNELPF